MIRFDPDAATAAYMATLSPAAHARATAYTQGGHWLLLWGWLVTVLAAWIILRSGLLVRIRDRIERRRARPNLAVLGCVVAFLVADWLLELPWSIYSAWWREGQYGLTKQPLGGWLGENLMSFAISAIVWALIGLAVFALIRRAPRWWWAWSGGVVVLALAVLLILGPILIEPLFNTYTPAPPGPTRDAVVALAKRSGVPSDKIFVFNGSKQSERYTANVSGLFGSARVAMSDTMFAQGADLAEVRGVVGHEMGHYARAHVLWMVLGFGLIAIVGLWIVGRFFPVVLGWTGQAARIAGIADPAGLPVLMAMIATLGLLATPLTNTLTRLEESDADRFSYDHAHEPDGMAKALVKTIAYRASSPSWIEEAIFYDHPSVERRVHRAMVWKAQHPDLVGK
ncbi:M48 family metalloprotease [Sphingomonas nostoxanthinifaciens]|uniref:M48 family metalloprotease n=1 Tax=Sphingomonas nostoxanthinifaciens TaxID=2872652 RepID=UPI001CC1D3BD|nr:M48 family metalloprotease [Sphingomonas nostoxanthinifaciens]UAK24916.1 M48 family metalloprotease [Sphingomonas nostoxanthinifaciens]